MVSSMVFGNWLVSIRGPPIHDFLMWMTIGGGGGADVSASKDSVVVDGLTGSGAGRGVGLILNL